MNLSQREVDLLRLLVSGHTLKSAARDLDIAHSTAKDYAERVRLKMQARSNMEAVAKAVRAGIA